MTDDQSDETQFTVPDGFERMDWVTGFGGHVGPLFNRHNEDGTYVRAFSVSSHHTNGMGNCHGGMLMAFADFAFGHAIARAANRYWVTVRLLTDFVSGAKLGDWVEGNAEIVGLDDDFYTVKGRVWVGDRTIISGTGLFKALGERKK